MLSIVFRFSYSLVILLSVYLVIEYCFLIPSLFNFQHYTSSELCLSAFQAPVDPSAVLGGFSGSNYSEVMVATPLLRSFWLLP